MRIFCPECYHQHWIRLEEVVLSHVVEGIGQCPRCKKYWNDDGEEMEIKVQVKKKEFNPSFRKKEI